MMIQPNPGVLDQLIRERQEKLRARPLRAQGRPAGGLRVRLGRALIVAGSALSGEQVEVAARHPAMPKAA